VVIFVSDVLSADVNGVAVVVVDGLEVLTVLFLVFRFDLDLVLEAPPRPRPFRLFFLPPLLVALARSNMACLIASSFLASSRSCLVIFLILNFFFNFLACTAVAPNEDILSVMVRVFLRAGSGSCYPLSTKSSQVPVNNKAGV
jgi:hypothetical protein